MPQSGPFRAENQWGDQDPIALGGNRLAAPRFGVWHRDNVTVRTGLDVAINIGSRIALTRLQDVGFRGSRIGDEHRSSFCSHCGNSDRSDHESVWCDTLAFRCRHSKLFYVSRQFQRSCGYSFLSGRGVTMATPRLGSTKGLLPKIPAVSAAVPRFGKAKPTGRSSPFKSFHF